LGFSLRYDDEKNLFVNKNLIFCNIEIEMSVFG
jgi:hypothetical protein